MLDSFSDIDSLFEVKIFSSLEEKEELVLSSLSGILFVLEGEIWVHSVSSNGIPVGKRKMCFLPSGRSHRIIYRQNSHSLLLIIPEIEMFCYHFFPSSVFRIQVVFNSDPFLLSMSKHMDVILQDIEYYTMSGFSQPLLLKIKTFELFYFFANFQTTDSLAHFFAPVLFPDYIFSRFVLENYQSVRTVEELAKLSHYSSSGFQKQFKKVFGMAPYKWMTIKKTEKIYYEIQETSKPLKVIAEEAGFAGLSQLSDFCRKRLGKSPSEIRKKR